jgi:hypothetical protein
MQTINNDDLEEIRELGSGTYGSVYHGKWRGCDVAIKRIKASCFAGRPSERERLVCFFLASSFYFRNFRQFALTLYTINSTLTVLCSIF